MMQQPSTEPETLEDLPARSEAAYRDYRAGRTSLEAVYGKLLKA